MKIIKMIDWEKGDDKYPRCSDQDNLEEFRECVKEFLKRKNLKICGPQHQNWEYGAPLIEHENKLYIFTLSVRKWGQLMAEAFDIDDSDHMAYCEWAFKIPVEEIETSNYSVNPMLMPDIINKGE
jgi:hypothetical protein